MNLGPREVSLKSNPYVIAEIGSNHNGDMDLARKMIQSAKSAGCDCVKFQSWTKVSLFSKSVYAGNPELEKEIDDYSVTEDQLRNLHSYAKGLAIDFTSTPFCQREVDFLTDDLNVPFIKIASMDLNNYPFIDYIARKSKPIVLSTGLATVEEIDEAVRLIQEKSRTGLILLHCIAQYPPKDTQLHLNNLDLFRKRYRNVEIGFSDHTVGTAIPIAAIAKGAVLIEKHFTLDKQLPGWDHPISATEDEMAFLVESGRRIVQAMGSYEREVTEEDIQKAKMFRRSIVAKSDIPAGKVIEIEDLDMKRPGTGLPPKAIVNVIGAKAKKKIEADEVIQAEDIQ